MSAPNLKLENLAGRLGLSDLEQPKVKPIFVDFLSKDFLRRQREPISSQLLAKAVGLNSNDKKAAEFNVLDATAGLGTDAALLAFWGCEVLALERNQIVFQLLEDGLRRAESSPGIFERLKIKNLDANEYMMQRGNRNSVPKVVYLDPMYPEAKKTALPRKEMQILRKLLASESEETTLKTLINALEFTSSRVVVKRPPQANALVIGSRKPHHSIGGKAVRYDIYLK